MLEELKGIVRYIGRSVIFQIMGDDSPVFPLESGGRIDVSKKAPFDVDINEYRLLEVGWFSSECVGQELNGLFYTMVWGCEVEVRI